MKKNDLNYTFRDLKMSLVFVLAFLSFAMLWQRPVISLIGFLSLGYYYIYSYPEIIFPIIFIIWGFAAYYGVILYKESKYE